MTVREILDEARDSFEHGGIDTPFLDACLLLAHAMGVSKEFLLAAYPDEAEESAVAGYRNLIEKRLSGIPVSYLRNVKEFYGREFFVDSRVLVPRPDTETLVDTVLELKDRIPCLRRMHDTCTGTGCIALTLKLEAPDLEISASDISREAGEVFAINRERFGISVPFRESDLLSSVPGTFDLITANPPYITEAEYRTMADMRWPEPREALAAGENGLDVLVRLIEESVDSLLPNGYLVCEAAQPQFPALRRIMAEAGYREIDVRKDLGGRDRVILGRR